MNTEIEKIAAELDRLDTHINDNGIISPPRALNHLANRLRAVLRTGSQKRSPSVSISETVGECAKRCGNYWCDTGCINAPEEDA